jgi:hypothetical protein
MPLIFFSLQMTVARWSIHEPRSLLKVRSESCAAIHTMSLAGLSSHARLISSQMLGSRSANLPNSKPHLLCATCNVQALLMLLVTLCAAGLVGGVVIRRTSLQP